jgi:hypothetical protein
MASGPSSSLSSFSVSKFSIRSVRGLAPKDVEGAMAQHGVNPRPGLAAGGVEASGPLPDLHKSVVDRLFGQRATPQKAEGDAEHRGASES